MADREIRVHTTAFPLACINERLNVYYAGDSTAGTALGQDDTGGVEKAVALSCPPPGGLRLPGKDEPCTAGERGDGRADR